MLCVGDEMKILIVEDEQAINDLVMMNLRLVGYDCLQAYHAEQALELAQLEKPGLVLLDVMIPGADGFDLLRQQAFRNIPVILLTAKGGTADKVTGLRLGADDYIVKPFEAVELLARVEAVLRRSRQGQEVFRLDDTAVYLAERRATVREVPVELTNREFELLEALIRNRNLALSREKLLDIAWGYDYLGDSRTVDVHITKLRKKLKWENRIKTVFKLGYRLEVS